jgi:hypothetical protein
MNPLVRIVATLTFLLGSSTPLWSQGPEQGRFFHSGDGQLHLASEKNGLVFKGRFRKGPGLYDPQALEEICAVFGAPCKPELGLSLRLIDFIDFIEDTLRPGARVVIVSGYRNPEYNTMLNNKGRLAAKGSLHQYGMAADLRIEGVSARRIWNYVRTLNFGGTGYYQGNSVHVDVGPARFWDEKSSGVGTGISDDNKLIGLVTDFDRYLPGETVVLRFIRMTAFPIGVSRKFYLQRERKQAGNEVHSGETVATFEPVFALTAEEACPKFGDIGQMAFIRAGLPGQLPAGRYVIRAAFCENPWPEMPLDVVTASFEVVNQPVPQ